jgi:hypothetical protein
MDSSVIFGGNPANNQESQANHPESAGISVPLDIKGKDSITLVFSFSCRLKQNGVSYVKDSINTRSLTIWGGRCEEKYCARRRMACMSSNDVWSDSGS